MFSEPVCVQFAELLEAMQLPGRARAVYSKLLEINRTHARAGERPLLQTLLSRSPRTACSTQCCPLAIHWHRSTGEVIENRRLNIQPPVRGPDRNYDLLVFEKVSGFVL